MRDPKTHAKVLAQRGNTVLGALVAVHGSGGSDREERFEDLLGRIENDRRDWQRRTGWYYDHLSNPPSWRHTEIIPDTEEES